MADIDQITAARAGLELLVTENDALLERFSGLLARLEQLEALPPEERHGEFRAMAQDGSLTFNGVDVRRFAPTAARQLTPGRFLRRTHRRLVNTASMIEQFQERGTFEEGTALRDRIGELTQDRVDETDTRAVLDFRRRVDAVRNDPLFAAYLEHKQHFIKQDADFRTDAEITATKESVQDNQDLLEERGKALAELSEEMASGAIDAEQAAERMDALALPEGA